ncbi:MAG: hypothetical protein GF329_16285 [Candidatus Lokiarchaeota archaeon]|nr:hypothetical protein [Candidatus Lokiarchaeota archaeon]
MKYYFTTIGRSGWATINSYYAVLKHEEYFPDKINVIAEEISQDKVKMVKNGLEILSDEFNVKNEINTEIVKISEIRSFGEELNSKIKEIKNLGHKVALDITSGRKILVGSILIKLEKDNVDYIFYLDISTIKKVNKPYEMIPSHIQVLRKLL